jgi:prophage DNA circulation protein
MIPSFEVKEGARIANLAADMLLATSNDQIGRAGSDLRRTCGDLKAHADVYIVQNVIADKLSNCFEQARITGATLDEFNRVRDAILTESVTTLVGTLIKNACVCFSLQQMSLVLVGIKFTSSEDVNRVRADLHPAFDQAEEVAADEMALMVYRALVSLHAAVTFHLYETARPLPQILQYRFASPRPTLVQSHRLYDTAARADELREENKVVHPAFAPREGRALAF